MERDDFLKEIHWKCKTCGTEMPIDAEICTNPDCRAKLSVHGEILFPLPIMDRPAYPNARRVSPKDDSEGEFMRAVYAGPPRNR